MLSYYKFNESYFRLSSENTFFEQLNNFPNEKVIIYGAIAESVQILNDVRVRDNWAEITEQEYNTVKSNILTFLSAN
jgi:predicted DNA-binding protein with PD1-like motif